MAVDAKNVDKAKGAGSGKKPVKSLFDEHPKKKDDLAELFDEIRERPGLYIGIVVFLIVCILAGFLYTAYRNSSREDVMTAYAKALEKTEPAEQLAALEPLAGEAGSNAEEVVYVAAETAYRAGQYDTAKTLFERVRTEFPQSMYAPDAVEGLGYIAENAKEFDSALAHYQNVQSTWPTSFAARRQPLNIAKLQERQGKLAEAVTAYREQLQVFPGSTLAQEASAALARIEKTNPDLFPKPEMPAVVPPVEGVATPPAEGAAPAMPGDLDLQLQAPVVDPSTAPTNDLNLQLTTPSTDVSAPEPAPADESAPAPAEPAAPATN